MSGKPVYINNVAAICSLGTNLDIIAERLYRRDDSGLTHTEEFTPGTRLPLGVVNDVLPELAEQPYKERCRSNQLLMAALNAVRNDLEELRHGIAPVRIGVVIGTSTSGIAEGEKDMITYLQRGQWPEEFDYRRQEMANPASALARWVGARGPAYVISTACSSGAKALASARRLLRMNLCDLVIAGGVDSLCQMTVRGFSSLEAVSNAPCVPFSRNRNGINIGEGAALFLMSRNPGPVCLSGVGESSDAYHFSAPHPEGKGAAEAMSLALADANLRGEEIDYINLHGTATAQNDSMESLAVAKVLGTGVAASSTKGYTGHTLGAAGALEAAFCWKSLTTQASLLPIHLWDNCPDPSLAPINLIRKTQHNQPINRTMSNSFAFGGNNISLILERQAP